MFFRNFLSQFRENSHKNASQIELTGHFGGQPRSVLFVDGVVSLSNLFSGWWCCSFSLSCVCCFLPFVSNLSCVRTRCSRPRTRRPHFTTPTTQHDNGLALCHRIILDSAAHRWVQAGHPRYTGARKVRPWARQTSHVTRLRERRDSGYDVLFLGNKHGSEPVPETAHLWDSSRTNHQKHRPERRNLSPWLMFLLRCSDSFLRFRLAAQDITFRSVKSWRRRPDK